MIRILPAVDEEGTYILWDGDTACGRAEAEFGECVKLISVEAPDNLLAEGMVRAVLNAGRVREISRAICEDTQLFPLLKRLEFTLCDEGMEVNISEFFFRDCQCKG